MSYILDALRKADAERERDPARGIHAQPMAGLPAAERAPRNIGWIAGAAAGLLLVAGLVFFTRSPAPAPAPAAPVAMTAPTSVAPTQPAPLKAQAPAAPAVADAVLPPPPPAVARPPATVARPAAPARPVAVAAAASAPASMPASAPAAATAAPAVLKSPAGDGAGRVLALTDLPAEVQRELPKLAISGGVHSDNAAQRMLIVGGQVVGEGAVLAPGVVLEQIRARTAVLQFRGYRFSVGY